MKIFVPIAALGLLLLVGCQTVEVQTFVDPRFEIPEPARYSWNIGAVRLQGVQPENRAALQVGLIRTITRELGARGWTRTDSVSADLLVHFVVGSHSERVVTETATGDSSFGGRSTVALQQHRVRAGELVIDLVHPEAGVRVWRGAAEGTLGQTPDPAEAVRIADRVATRILKELP